jgi:hypothetical protein
MSGTPSSPGIMVLTLMSLFRRIEEIQAEKTYTYRVSLSLLEIYNENLRDLLATKGTATAVAASASGSSAAASGGGAAAAATGSSSGSSSLAASGEHLSEQLHNSGGVLHGHMNPNSLELREDPLKGMVVAGITEVRGINSSARILALLEQGNARRTTEPTRANEVSSRSHQVLQIHIERHEVTQGLVQAVKVGKLNLIDCKLSLHLHMSVAVVLATRLRPYHCMCMRSLSLSAIVAVCSVAVCQWPVPNVRRGRRTKGCACARQRTSTRVCSPSPTSSTRWRRDHTDPLLLTATAAAVAVTRM